MKFPLSLVYLIVCVLFANLGKTTLHAESYRHVATGLVFPDEIAGLRKAPAITDYEAREKGLGVGIAYTAPGITVTIYIFTLGLPAVSDDLQAVELRKHFKQASSDVFRAGELGHYEKVKQIESAPVSLSAAPNAARALHAEFSFVQNGTERLSHLYLLGYKNHFFKVRYTYDRAVSADAEAEREKLLATLDAILR